jgi:hypothetical protein
MIRKAALCAALCAVLACLSVAPSLRAQELHQTLGGCGTAAPLRTLQANPSNYRSFVAGLLPGDRLLLAAGTYTAGLRLYNLNGQAGRCIVIEGPASGSPAVFVGSSAWNTISLKNASYLAIRNLTLDGMRRPGDGVKAERDSAYTHHINLEHLFIKNHNYTVQTVGISTKSPAWNWVIRHVTITATGTGLYLGRSDGTTDFANSLIENSLVYGTLGYNMEIKHQKVRSTGVGSPSAGTTVIRHNVFDKETGSLSGTEARPNVLVGHWPLSGPGSTDIYQIYGNLFFGNPYEALFQGEGNIALYNNLFVNRGASAIHIQPHNDKPRRIEVFLNTVVAAKDGILVTGANTAYVQRVLGNAVFAATPLKGGLQVGNLAGTYASAGQSLNDPFAALGTVDLFPLAGKLQGTALDLSPVIGYLEGNQDFNGLSRIATFRGAYAGDGANPGWQPVLAQQP